MSILPFRELAENLPDNFHIRLDIPKEEVVVGLAEY